LHFQTAKVEGLKMTTSLQRQLAALQSPATIEWTPERRVSILFNRKEAAGYDRETFYNIGKQSHH